MPLTTRPPHHIRKQDCQLKTGVQKKDFRLSCQVCKCAEMSKKRKNQQKPAPNKKGFQKKVHHAPSKAVTQKPSRQADLYGFHAVAEAWLNPARRIEALFLTSQAQSGFEATIKEAKAKGLKRPPVQIVDKDQLENMLPKGAVHQGIALACAPLDDIFLQDLIIRAENEPNMLLVMLDQVTDPHNVGAILRSACAFGAAAIIMQRKHAPEISGVLAKTACGAVEHVAAVYETNLSRALDELKQNGFFAYGLDERGEQEIAQVPKDGRRVLVLGAEGPGIRRLVSEHCDVLVRLPMHGAMPSINVSNAAAVALYEVSKT